MQGERQKFLADEWPRIQATIQRLGLNAEDLLKPGPNGSRSPNSSDDKPSTAKDKDEEDR
jgi:hypothetical protein